jgi:hypothetical protein
VCISSVPRTCHLPRQSVSFRFYHPNNIWRKAQIMKLLIVLSSPVPSYRIPIRPKYLPQHPILVTPSAYVPIRQTKFHSHIYIYTHIIITMGRQPYMGLGLLFPMLLGLVHLWQWVTSSILMWLPQPSGSQSGDLGEKWPLNFARKFLLHVVNLRHGTDGPKEVVLRIFITLKNPSTSIEPANLGSSGEHANR